METLNIIISLTSFLVALIALAISMKIAKASTLKPLILQELLQLSKFYHSIPPPKTPKDQVDSFLEANSLIHKYQFVLKISGFEEQLNKYFKTIKESAFNRVEDDRKRLMTEAGEFQIQLFGNVDSRMEKILSKAF
jgi:hypothetical protein